MVSSEDVRRVWHLKPHTQRRLRSETSIERKLAVKRKEGGAATLECSPVREGRLSIYAARRKTGYARAVSRSDSSAATQPANNYAVFFAGVRPPGPKSDADKNGVVSRGKG